MAKGQTAMKLTIGCVTRGRPERVIETVRIALSNIRERDTKLFILADEDDVRMNGFGPVPDGSILNVQPREDSVGAKWNRLPRLAEADVYMCIVDHTVILTPGFDTKILDASMIFHDGIGCVVTHLANLSFPFYQAPTARMVEIMGGIYPTMFPYWFVDHWLDDICKMTGRYVMADVACDSSKKPNTQDFREPHLWASLYDSLVLEREEMAERLFEKMDEPEWRKEMLRRQWPLFHQRSRMINNMVRGISELDTSRDERYMRIRAKGISMIENAFSELQRKSA